MRVAIAPSQLVPDVRGSSDSRWLYALLSGMPREERRELPHSAEEEGGSAQQLHSS